MLFRYHIKRRSSARYNFNIIISDSTSQTHLYNPTHLMHQYIREIARKTQPRTQNAINNPRRRQIDFLPVSFFPYFETRLIAVNTSRTELVLHIVCRTGEASAGIRTQCSLNPADTRPGDVSSLLFYK